MGHAKIYPINQKQGHAWLVSGKAIHEPVRIRPAFVLILPILAKMVVGLWFNLTRRHIMDKVIHHEEFDVVLCDYCNKDFSNRADCGGFIFCSNAVCPECAPDMLESIKKHAEERFIRSKCPKDKPFGKWIQEDIRNGEPGSITVVSF